MTEAEWLACADPQPMLEFLRGKVSERKLWLLLVACHRRCASFFGEPIPERAIQVSERIADGCIARKELRQTRRVTLLALADGIRWKEADADFMLERFNGFHFEDNPTWVWQMTVKLLATWAVGESLTVFQLHRFLRTLADTQPDTRKDKRRAILRQGQCDSARDIFGNPFRPVAVAPSWFTSTVSSLAQAIYDERAFDRMPILADALEDAGCDKADILNHCRQPGDHVRGCWCVDLLLGKV